ncbi:copper resistance D family protein [Haloechinothrix halophila]|uniref:copper resistance D family protein n=1 Tax=Haloechinothrix halophila TaxID=1069073 RepID=UPI000406AE55|nr:CopD family protein [Haloechinothrix halophila]
MTSPSAAARLAPFGAAVAAALAGALAGAGLTVATPVTGIADPGTGVLVALPLVRALLGVTAAATVGLCLLPLLLGTGGPGDGSGPGSSRDTADRAEPVLHRARRWSVVTSMVWAATAVTALLLHTAEFTVQADAIGLADVVGYVTTVGTGKALLGVIVLTLLLCGLNVLAVRHRERVPAEIRTGLGVFALLPLPATGHAAGWLGQDYAVVALELHVISAVVWLGGLAALAVSLASDTALLATALPRFSVVATACIATTAVTGTISGLTQLGTHGSVSVAAISAALIGTPYGALLLAKLVCFGAIALAGAKMRWRILPAVVASHDESARIRTHDGSQRTRTRRPAFVAWASAELLLLGLAFGIAAVLSRAGFG